jgi:hypothetical protein
MRFQFIAADSVPSGIPTSVIAMGVPEEIGHEFAWKTNLEIAASRNCCDGEAKDASQGVSPVARDRIDRFDSVAWKNRTGRERPG